MQSNITGGKCHSFGCDLPHMQGSEFCYLCASYNNHYHESIREMNQLIQKEVDPNGLNNHQSGAKADAGKVRMHLITGGMARAITEVAKVGTFGAEKYTDGGWVHVDDGFRRYEDAQQRHAAKRHIGEVFDQDSKLLHLAHEAWNAMAKLDLYLREIETLGNKA
jgi:hypothetical protein